MTTNFMDAKVGEHAWVYKCPPGDEFGWVTDPEYWDDLDEPVVVKRQRWCLVAEDEVRFHPSHELCPSCGGDGASRSPVGIDIECEFCRGDGGHPLAGQMEELA